ncbi:hypothetical protein KBC80_02600 [Candidatus Woesebacteria bacterium]|nr:hypothetical protein [Candidatus Woesebacteria bacterium]
MTDLELSPFTSDPKTMEAMDRLTVLRALHASKSERGSGVKKLTQHAERIGVNSGAIQHALAENNNLQGRVTDFLQWASAQFSSRATA